RYSLAFDVIFPFVNQMILDVGIVKHREEVGFYPGIIMAIYPATSFLAGSVFACTRVIVAELTDKNQARTFQWHLLSYQFGKIIGLPLTSFPNCYAIFSVILGYVYLPKTAPRWRLRVHTVNAEPNLRADYYTAISLLNDFQTDVAASSISYSAILTCPILSVMLASCSGGLLSDGLIVISSDRLSNGHQIGSTTWYTTILSLISTHFNSAAHVHRIFMWIWSLPIIILPCANLVARTTDNIWMLNACLFLFHSTWSLASFTWPTLNNMIVDVTPSAEALSTGLSMLTIALPQAVTSAFIAPLFAYSVESGVANGYIVWIIFLVLSMCLLICFLA
ncbi:hypothetical protein M422DRAFT_32083, partial [Sphaerobolus stellatus SS14]